MNRQNHHFLLTIIYLQESKTIPAKRSFHVYKYGKYNILNRKIDRPLDDNIVLMQAHPKFAKLNARNSPRRARTFPWQRRKLLPSWFRIYYLLRSIFIPGKLKPNLFALSYTTYAYAQIPHKQTISNLGHIIS